MSTRSRSSFADSFRLGSSLASVASAAERRQRYVRLVRASILFFVVLAIGAYGFWTLTGHQHTALQCLYMTVVTISTVGFTEVIPVDTDALKVFTMGTILFGGASIAYFLTSIAAVIVEGDLVYRFWQRRLLNRVAAQREHVLVCGLGLTGRRTFSALHHARVPVVGLDVRPERVETLMQSAGSDVLFIVGDCFEEDTLLAAAIGEARGLVAAFPDDRDNLLLCVTARQLNPNLRVVVRLNHKTNAPLFDNVASATVDPATLSGARLANEAVRPDLLAFTDALLTPDTRDLLVDELPVEPHAPLAGATLADAHLVSRTGALVIGHRLGRTGSFTYNPPATLRIEHGATLLVLGDRRALARARRLLRAAPKTWLGRLASRPGRPR
ncbi:MAG: potassium channel protein [Deltaproteobacteria bacterium]|nr:MAG: potassium channel protein [Deltaproteobacteria bacterium]